jgi:hypothetical protein
MRWQFPATLMLLLSVGQGALAQLAVGQNRVEIPRRTVSVTAAGTTVEISVLANLSYRDDGGDIAVSGLSHLDLGKLQTKMPALVENLDWPKDRCQQFADDNLITTPTGATLYAAADGGVKLSVEGSYQIWSCGKNPVLSTKVVWSAQQVAPGVTTQVPVVVTSPGPPVTTRLAEDTTTWSWNVSVAPAASSAKDEAGAITRVMVTPDTSNSKTKPAGVWTRVQSKSGVPDQIGKLFDQLFSPATFAPTLGSQINAKINSIDWTTENNALAARVTWSAKVPGFLKAQFLESIASAANPNAGR